MKNNKKKATTKSKKNENIIVTDDVSRCDTDPNASETECKASFKICLRGISIQHFSNGNFDLDTITSYNFVLLYNIILH